MLPCRIPECVRKGAFQMSFLLLVLVKKGNYSYSQSGEEQKLKVFGLDPETEGSHLV